MCFIEKWKTEVEIDIPFLDPTHRLFNRGEGFGWTGIFADPTALTKSIDPVSFRRSWRKGRVGKNGA
jgi:hypothetical protein